jgi:hypothetical protein
MGLGSIRNDVNPHGCLRKAMCHRAHGTLLQSVRCFVCKVVFKVSLFEPVLEVAIIRIT